MNGYQFIMGNNLAAQRKDGILSLPEHFGLKAVCAFSAQDLETQLSLKLLIRKHEFYLETPLHVVITL